MDVLAMDLNRSTSLPDSSREATVGGEPRVGRLARLIERLVRVASGGRDGGDVVARRRAGLLAYTAATIVLGIVLLAVTTLTSAPWATIDPGIGSTTVLAGPTGGLLLWLMYGLIGSMRVLRVPGGSTMTFHMPFVGAATILGGPTAGAWVAFLATIERRELETQPWYGILANHAITVIGAVLAGVAVQAVAVALPVDVGGGGLLLAASVGAVVIAVVPTALGVVTVMLREDLTFRAVIESQLGQVGRITAVECALVVVMALAYLQIGWWAPLQVAGFVLVVWDNHSMPPPDQLTGLLTREGYERRLDIGVGRLRRGLSGGATVIGIDLDLFSDVNNTHGHGIGDEVLREVGRRLAGQARRPDDLVGRPGGDEFTMFLPNLVNAEVAVERAEAIVAELKRPIGTSAGTMHIGASVGVVVVHGWGGVPSASTLQRQADQAMYHAKRSGGGVHLYDGLEPFSFT